MSHQIVPAGPELKELKDRLQKAYGNTKVSLEAVVVELTDPGEKPRMVVLKVRHVEEGKSKTVR